MQCPCSDKDLQTIGLAIASVAVVAILVHLMLHTGIMMSLATGVATLLVVAVVYTHVVVLPDATRAIMPTSAPTPGAPGFPTYFNHATMDHIARPEPVTLPDAESGSACPGALHVFPGRTRPIKYSDWMSPANNPTHIDREQDLRAHQLIPVDPVEGHCRQRTPVLRERYNNAMNKVRARLEATMLPDRNIVVEESDGTPDANPPTLSLPPFTNHRDTRIVNAYSVMATRPLLSVQANDAQQAKRYYPMQIQLQ